MHMLVAMHACIQDAWHWCQHVCLWGCRALGEVVVCACMFVFGAKLVHILLWEVWCLMDFWVGAQGCKTHMSKYNYGGACMWSHAELVGAHVACLCVHASGMGFSVHVLLTNVLCPCRLQVWQMLLMLHVICAAPWQASIQPPDNDPDFLDSDAEEAASKTGPASTCGDASAWTEPQASRGIG